MKFINKKTGFITNDRGDTWDKKTYSPDSWQIYNPTPASAPTPAPAPAPVSSAPAPSKSSDTRTWGIVNPNASLPPVSAPVSAPAQIAQPTGTLAGQWIRDPEELKTLGEQDIAKTSSGKIYRRDLNKEQMAMSQYVKDYGAPATSQQWQSFHDFVYSGITPNATTKEVMTDLGKVTIEKKGDITVGGTDVATGEVVDDLAGAGQRFGIDFEAPLEARQEAIEAGQEELDPISAQITEIQNEIQDTVEFYEAEKETIENRLAPMGSINRELHLMNEKRTAALAKLEIREAIAQGQFDRSFALIKENADLIYDMELRKLDWLKELDTREYNEAKTALADEQKLALSGMIKLNMEQFQTAVAQARNQGMTDTQIEQDLFYRKPGTDDIYLRSGFTEATTPDMITTGIGAGGAGVQETGQPKKGEAYSEPEAKQLFIKYLDGGYGLTEARERVEQITGQKIRFGYKEARQFISENQNASAEELKPVLLEFCKGVLTITEINALLAGLKKDEKSSGREL